MSRPLHFEPVPEARVAGARAVGAAILAAQRIVLTTHVNADGDGMGSEVALLHLLRGLGKKVAIVNPTPLPPRFSFLMDGLESHDQSGAPVPAIKDADLFLVLDIADLGRLGALAQQISQRRIVTACVDHHISPGTLPDGPRLVDATASATAELVHDLALSMEWEISSDAAEALYVGLLTDTGGFRFGNTTPRVLRLAAELLERGLSPEAIYEQVYATAPVGRIRLTAAVLDTLVHEAEIGLTWVVVPEGVMERFEVSADDLDGLVEFARSIQGTRLALLFRRLASGKVKVSFRSVGDFDVAAFAQQFGGGGHAKASGASLEGSLEDAQQRVLTAAREALGARAAAS